MTRKARITLIVVSAVAATGLLLSGLAVASGVAGSEPTTSDARAAVRGPTPPKDRAQALVNASGTMDRVRGFISHTHPGAGLYCIKLPSSIKTTSYVPVATVNYSDAPPDAIAQWRSSSFDCPDTQWVDIRTYSPAGVLSDAAFSLVVP